MCATEAALIIIVTFSVFELMTTCGLTPARTGLFNAMSHFEPETYVD